MLNRYLYECVLKCDPFATEDDILEIREINEWEVLIVFKDGRKIIYDRFTNYHKNVFYKSIDELTDEQEKKEFAYNLRIMMKRKWIIQDELADRLGVTQTTVSNWINGRSAPDSLTLRKIAKILDCSMDDFFYKEY